MTFVVKDRVFEKSTTTGTGTLTLGGAEDGYFGWSAAIGDGNTAPYVIWNRDVPTEFEFGVGTVGSGTLARTTPLGGSNGTSAVNFSAGEKDVFCSLLTAMPTKHSVFVPAAGMFSRITGGAEYSQTETGTNRVQRAGFLFDGTTQEHVQFYLGAPKSWNKGTVSARFLFAPTTTVSQATRWEIAGRAFGDGDNLEAAFGTAVGVNTSHTTAYRVELSADTSAMTIAGTPITSDLLVFQVSRAPANAGDTYTADALLLGVWVDFTFNAAMDD